MENQAGLLVHTHQPEKEAPVSAAPRTASQSYALPLGGTRREEPQTSNMSFLEQQRAKIQSEAETRDREVSFGSL